MTDSRPPLEKLEEIERKIEVSIFQLGDPAGDLLRALTLVRELPTEIVATWRPWDTCPTDGRAVLARFDATYCETVCKTPEGWYWYEDGDTSGTRTPTHWMPVPALSEQKP